jgi:hypothetical protein
VQLPDVEQGKIEQMHLPMLLSVMINHHSMTTLETSPSATDRFGSASFNKPTVSAPLEGIHILTLALSLQNPHEHTHTNLTFYTVHSQFHRVLFTLQLIVMI